MAKWNDEEQNKRARNIAQREIEIELFGALFLHSFTTMIFNKNINIAQETRMR